MAPKGYNYKFRCNYPLTAALFIGANTWHTVTDTLNNITDKIYYIHIFVFCICICRSSNICKRFFLLLRFSQLNLLPVLQPRGSSLVWVYSWQSWGWQWLEITSTCSSSSGTNCDILHLFMELKMLKYKRNLKKNSLVKKKTNSLKLFWAEIMGFELIWKKHTRFSIVLFPNRHYTA